MKNSKVIVLILILSLGPLTACSEFSSIGCGFGTQFTTGEHTMISNGIERIYYLELPEKYKWLTIPMEVEFEICGVDRPWSELNKFDLEAA